MFGLRAGRRPPVEIISLMDRNDHVVSWAPVEDGTAVLASRFGLWWPEATGPRLIGWHLVDKAVWNEGNLMVIEAEVIDDLLLVDRSPVTVRLAEPRDLPPTIRKRVEASVAQSEVGAVPGGLARFVARRVPGRDGLTWWARLEPGTRDTQQAREAVRQIVDSLRAPQEEI